MATMELHKLRHRRAHSGASSVESDYGPQKMHTSTGADVSSTSPPSYSNTAVLSDSDVPPAESEDPHYRTYSVHNLDMQNITLHANQEGPALYTIINSTFTASANSVVLHAGARTTPPIGAANISAFKGTNQFGVRTGASTALEGMEGRLGAGGEGAGGNGAGKIHKGSFNTVDGEGALRGADPGFRGRGRVGEVAYSCAGNCDDSSRDVEAESKAKKESVRVYQRRSLAKEFTDTDLINF
ncbi:hypothetical protein V492_05153 [Pseudogymnoascus sp. VKM F-4246]|nr:hypothetical protein V492_05153 [Pseudogymnoascus sp. VKM F-4246]